MRTLILLVSLITMAGCASTQSTLKSVPSFPSIEAFATLAESGTFEMELAPAYTKLAMLRHTAASKLRAKVITVDEAQWVQDGANLARVYLDKARNGYKQDEQEARSNLGIANGIMKKLEERLL